MYNTKLGKQKGKKIEWEKKGKVRRREEREWF